MWDRYRKTFVGMQAVILLVTVGMYLTFGRHWALAGKFFLTMQVASLIGAYWGDRLRGRMRGGASWKGGF